MIIQKYYTKGWYIKKKMYFCRIKPTIMKINKILAMAVLATCSCGTSAQKASNNNLNMLIGFTDGGTSKGLYKFNQETGLAKGDAVMGEIDQPHTSPPATTENTYINRGGKRWRGNKGWAHSERSSKAGDVLRLINTQSTMDEKSAEENGKGKNDGSGPFASFSPTGNISSLPPPRRWRHQCVSQSIKYWWHWTAESTFLF